MPWQDQQLNWFGVLTGPGKHQDSERLDHVDYSPYLFPYNKDVAGVSMPATR